ncbi:MAG: hypothetical protein IH955_02080, partial [Chloroflexi bacterium]|nr:hypothetical protein [Chloroflexota bacterium]
MGGKTFLGAQGPRGVGAERMARNLPSREKARHLTSVPGLWFDEALNAQDALATVERRRPRLIYADEFPRE